MLAAMPKNILPLPVRSPQLENGFTRIANELLDAMIAARLSARQWSVVMAVVRKTYGFNKKEDDIGLGQLAAMTGIDKAHLSRTVRELSSLKIITRSVGTHGHTLGINKNFDEWELLKEQPIAESATSCQKSNPPVAERATPPIAESATTKDNPSKDNYQKTEKICAPQADRASSKPARAGQTGRAMTAAMQARFERFYQAYPRKRSRGVAEKAFAKLNPDDELLETMLAVIDVAKRSSDWVNGFVPYPASWLNAKGWMDEIQTEYTPEQRAVIDAYNEALSESLGHIDAEVFSESRAGRINGFMALSDKARFWERYFPYVRDNCELPPGVGLDYLISREGFTKVKGGQHERKA